MAEVGPRKAVWSRSLRQETALQDHYRRAIHHGDGGVENVGFERWNAACCLQEQIDSARGVEHARRLVKSRAIAARFTRRSVMKDLQGTELQTSFVRANSTCGGLSSEDDSLTRSQALERFGIDLGRVGVMTSARTGSRHSVIDRSATDQGTVRGSNGERVAVATSSCDAGVGRKAAQKPNRTPVQRGRGDSSAMTTVTKGVAAKRQNIMLDKLKVFDNLLSDELISQMPAHKKRGKKGEAPNESARSEDGSTGVSERNGTGNKNVVDIVGDCGAGSNGKGDESRPDVLPVKKPSPCAMLAEKPAYCCEDPRALVPEPKNATAERGERGEAADTCNAALPESGRAKEVNVERHPRHKEALPNHRPCLWWASLLPTEINSACIPDMVFSAPIGYSSSCNELWRGTETNAAGAHNPNNGLRTTSLLPSTGCRIDTATNAPAGSSTKRPPTKSSWQQSLLWAFSKVAKHEDGGGGGASTSTSACTAPPNTHLSVASLVGGEENDGSAAKAYPFTEDSSRVGKLGSIKQNSSPSQHPSLVQQRLYTEVIDGKEGLLRATRAICECGRRGGGGAGGEGRTSKLSLPLALLKVWARESSEERGRNSLRGKLGTSCRGRRLMVVSLWTQTEVFRALRDIARGRWLRRGEQSSGFFGGDQDACCVQAFTKSVQFTDGGVNHPRYDGGTDYSNTLIVDGGNQRRRVRRVPPDDSGLSGPVFYRVAWRRTGEKLIVWKMQSRYPYVSSLSAHFCPLVRVGSATPFTAGQAEEGAVATAKVKTEHLSKVLRRAYDPTLQRLWADWAVNESDGRWLLIEVHGIKTDADVHNAAAARAKPPAFAEVESKVYRSKHCTPPKHFCGNPDDLKARIAATNSTQEFSPAEIEKRAATIASTYQPSRPSTPSKVAASTKKALLAQRGAASGQGRSRQESGGARQMRNQYWRCAGDFCETYSAGRRRKPPLHGKVDDNAETISAAVERQLIEGVKVKKSNGATMRRGGGLTEEDVTVGEAGRRGEHEVEDIIGGRKHALAVEIPRTVLFRMVLNARAALLGWRPSASDFSQMEKPVQLCSACFTVCNTLERERIETTRRAMEAADQAAKEGKTKRNRRPPGWKSRVQHELEESLDADRHVVSRLIDNFENISSATAKCKKKRASSPSASTTTRGNNQFQTTQKCGDRTRGGVSVTWADPCPLAEVHLDGEERRADVSAQSTPRGKVSLLAAGHTTLVASTRRAKTAPLTLASGENETPPAQHSKLTEKISFLGAATKGKPEEGGKKRAIRVRRRAKERARRRLRSLATHDSTARYGRREPPGKNENKTDISAGNAGEAENTGHEMREQELPRILWPEAPTPPSSKVIADDGLTSDAHSTQTSGHDQPGKPHQRASSTSPDNKLGGEDKMGGGHRGGESGIDGAISDYDDDDFVDDTPPQLLRPIAPREKWEANEGISLEGQGDSEEIRRVSVDIEGFNSDYGDEDFEDEAT